ncbi:MAG: response regulator [Candidatus Omnitrophica bacterium]|nr:response regulator [Candidatus Omnitrophota bacterium]MBU1995845.1 response regulator [Candidatus Omnitrophota bacterium]MBU4334140.1 response regulator [Candidatus Omnitrophota bacterium]
MIEIKKSKKILLVDDDPVIVKLLENRLTEVGYKVVSALEAADGLQIAISDSPDLIVLDVMMPIINGYNFCHLLKSEEGKKEIPIIFLTSRNSQEDIQIGHKMGADAYLTKPVDIGVLIDKIEELL